MNQLIRFLSARWYLAVAALTAYIYFRVAPLQVDPHHDGVILAAAIAVADGHDILSGAFSQYGPLPAILQGSILWLFNTELLTLRYLTAVECLAIGFAIYKLSLEFTNTKLAKITAFFWLLASSVWVTQFPGSLLPWPSLISTMLVLYGLILLIRATQKNDAGRAIVAGIFLGLAGFCRIQAFAILPLILLLTIFKSRKNLRILKVSILGYIISLIAFSIYLFITKGFNDFIQQVVITPLFVYSAVGKGNNYNRFQFTLYVIESVAFAILFISTFYLLKKTKSKLNIVSIALITICMFIINLVGIWVGKSSLPIKFRVLLGEPLQNLVISPFYFSVVSTAAITVLIIFNKSEKFKELNFPELAVIVAAFGTIPQLYPQPDVMHLWWVAPIFLCSLLIQISKLTVSALNPSKILQTLFFASIILGTVASIQFIQRPWTEYKLGVLKGTFAHKEKAESLDIFRAIEKEAVVGETSFDCRDGVYAVANGVYLASDEWFVSWGFGPDVKPRVGNVRVICDMPQSYAESESFRLGMKLVSYQGNLTNKSIAILKRIE